MGRPRAFAYADARAVGGRRRLDASLRPPAGVGFRPTRTGGTPRTGRKDAPSRMAVGRLDGRTTGTLLRSV